LSNLESKNNIKKLFENPIISLSLIGIISLSIRIYYFPFEIPVIADGVDYFSYAVVTSQQGRIPIDWGLTNNGWSVFLSVIFSLFNSENFLQLTQLQRFTSIAISILTIIPVYFLCNRFVQKKFAIIGASLFVLDPRIILNAQIGITEPSYILLGTITLLLFLTNRYKIILLSFFTLGLCSIIRYEGFLFIFPLLIIFFIRFRKDKKIIQKLLIIVGLFFITIFPMMYSMNEAIGSDGIISPIFSGAFDWVNNKIIQGEADLDDPIYGEEVGENRILSFIGLGVTNTIKFLGWVLIPTFFLFIPIGIILFFKKMDYKNYTLILFATTIIATAFYAYARGIEETRYLYMMLPILCVISSLTIKKISEKIKKENIILLLIIIGVIFGSIVFLDSKKIDHEHEIELYNIAKDITNIANGINHYNPESKYIHVAEIANDWPIIPLPAKEENYNQEFNVKKISPVGYLSLNEYIENSKEKGLTHIVIKKDNNIEIFNNIFNNEEKYPFLVKKYDSLEQGFNFQIIMYEINYKKFEEVNKKD
jgi:hypothetical protein